MRKSFSTGVAVVVAAVAALVAALPQPADAALRDVGPSAPATVTCDFFTNELRVQAQIGASQAFTSQNVAYQLAIYDATRRSWLPSVTIDGETWDVVRHDRVSYYEAWAPDRGTYQQQVIDPWAPTPDLSFTLRDGDYYVYTRYAWANGSWFDSNGAVFSNNSSPWVMTRSYDWKFGLNGLSYCRI